MATYKFLRYVIVCVVSLTLCALAAYESRSDQAAAAAQSPSSETVPVPADAQPTPAVESISSKVHSAPESTEEAYPAVEETLEQMKERIGFEKVWQSEVPRHAFVGVAKCALCHKSESQGSQFGIWKESAHSRAFDTLGTPEALALGQKLGIADPQSSGKCLRCHSTAYNFGEQKVTEAVPVAEGISCETCHGPGKDYMGIKVMKDRAMAVKAGLIIPDEQTCLKCHNNTAPNVKEFHFKESWEKIKHPVPRKPE